MILDSPMRLDSIAAYTFNADVYCPNCIRTTAAFATAPEGEAAFMGRPTDGDNTEAFLDRWAEQDGIDRADENTFDSGDFPKVILYGSMDRMAVWICGGCYVNLLDEDDDQCDGSCIERPHVWRYGTELQFQSAICRRSGCNTVGTGDRCGDGECEGTDR